jgi:excisionase family DNA binding protein
MRNPNETRPDYLTVEELGRLLRVSRPTAYKLVTSGQVPRVRVGNQWRIPWTELERHLADSVARFGA